MWHLTSRSINEIVRAPDQFVAWDSLRERPADDFGLIVAAEPDENGDPIYVHTSALMTAWGREHEAAIFREIAISKGLPDTSKTDRQFAAERGSR